MNKQKPNTLEQYTQQFQRCMQLFSNKLHDYEAAWRILRLQSLTDQLYIKALRIRQIETTGTTLVNEGIEAEYIGLVNYGIIGLIQYHLGVADNIDITNSEALDLYHKYAKDIQELMLQKNHDYGEAWRSMRISSFTDLIISKILRVKQLEDLQENTLVSEGIPANYSDIVNYALFALIRLNEQ